MLDGFHNFLEHSVCIPKDVVVPETQNVEAAFLQISIAGLISFAFSVLTAVRFDNEHSFEGHEINDPRSDGHLPAEFYFGELARTKELPKLEFSVGQHVTKVTRLASFELGDSIFWHFPLTRSSLRSDHPLPQGERVGSRKGPVQEPGGRGGALRQISPHQVAVKPGAE